MAEEIILFAGNGGGMDQDSSPYNSDEFQRGSYRFALNARIGNTSLNNEGALENLPSSLSISNYFVWNGTSFVSGSAPAGTNTALNHYDDRGEGRIYWCVVNSNGNHTILYYVKSSRQIYELLQWSGLNFALTNFVSMTKINKYLILTDGNPADGTGNPPRCIDVNSVYILKATLGANFSEFHISFSKWLPVAPPIIDTSGQAAGNVFIKIGQYQFSYRYIYIGGFRSCFSPPSNFVSNRLLAVTNSGNPNPIQGSYTNFGVNTKGFVFDYNNPSNTAFQHTDARFYQFVDTIEYAYRDSEISNWRVFSRVKVNGFSPSTDITFANSGDLYNVAPNDIGQYFDSVPLLSRAVEAIDNRPMFGNNLDDLAPMTDFDVTDVSVATSKQAPDTNWFDPTLPDKKIQQFSFKENGVYKLGIIFKHYDGRSGLVQTLDKWTYNIPENVDVNPGSQEDFHALCFKIAGGIKPPVWAVDYQIVRTNCLNIEMFILGQVQDIKFLTLSSVKDNSLTVSNEVQDAASNYYDSYNTGGSQYSLIQRIMAAVATNIAVSVDQANIIYFDISNWSLTSTVGALHTSYSFNNNVFYNWQPGDRVRFFGSNGSNFGGGYVQYDQEIIQYVGTGIIIGRPENLNFIGNRSTVGTSPTPNANKLFAIEVYRPKKYSKDTDTIFYEMGEWYPVLEPGTNNRSFSKTDFTWTRPDTVTTSTVNGFTYYNQYPIVNGDVWLVRKNFFYSQAAGTVTQNVLSGWLGPFVNPGVGFNSIDDYPTYPQMNPDKNNAAGFWEHNVGRPLTAYSYLPVQFEKSNQIRFGGKFLEDSIFIGINNFQDDNQKIYPSEYGPIRAMVNTSNTQVKDVGQILMVICEEETMDVYVNRATLQQLGGQTQVSLSDQVLGSYNTLLGSYGTLNPESVSKRNSRVLFWNAKRGMWIRRSVDGLTPVSNYKMQNWFKDLSNLLIDTYSTSTPAKVLSVFDGYYEEWVTYINHSSLPGTFRGYSSYKSAAFDEDSKRWNTVYDYAPDIFAALENEVYSIIGTVVHIHYAGADYGSIYGVKKDCMWQPVANPEFRVTKVWRAINEQSTDVWSLPSIDGDFRSNSVVSQNSALLLTDLTALENTFWSDIKRDLNTPNASSSDQAIVNGDPMRSRALTLMLKLDPSVTWYSFINWLVVTFDRSEKTVKK